MVEQDLAPVDLRALLWGYHGDLSRLPSASPLTVAALKLWYKRGLCTVLSSDLSPPTSLFDNPAFPQGVGVPMLGSFHRSAWPQAHTFIILRLGTPAVPERTRDWLTSLHLTSFSKQLFLSSQIYRPLTEFERLCSLQDLPRHLLSYLYGFSSPLHIKTYPCTLGCGPQIWEGTSREQIARLHFTLRTSLPFPATHKKIILRFYPNGTGTQPRYTESSHPPLPPAGIVVQLLVHTSQFWWEWERICPFWSQVFQVYSNVYNEPLTPSPVIALLSILPGFIASQKRNLLHFFLSAAWQLIPLYWKATTTPQ